MWQGHCWRPLTPHHTLVQAWLPKREPLLCNPKGGELFFNELWSTQDRIKNYSPTDYETHLKHPYDGIQYHLPFQKVSAGILLLKKISLVRIHIVGRCVILKLEKESLIISMANLNVMETWLVL